MSRPRRGCHVAALRHDTAGGALVEFALVLPVLLVLAFGVIEWGRFFAQYSELLAAVRDGARVAAVRPAATSTEIASLTAIVQSLVVTRAHSSAINASMVTLQVVTTNGVRSMQVSTTRVPFASSLPLVPIPRSLPAVTAAFRHEFE